YWVDNGKLYKDNIIRKKYKNYQALSQGIKDLFIKEEKSVFYTLKNRGFCIDNSGQLSVYNKRLRLRRKKLSKNFVKLLLLKFGGLTIYKLKNKFIIEIFYN
ncbi:unnamed protein product, partial [marine sediment metagenome]